MTLKCDFYYSDALIVSKSKEHEWGLDCKDKIQCAKIDDKDYDLIYKEQKFIYNKA